MNKNSKNTIQNKKLCNFITFKNIVRYHFITKLTETKNSPPTYQNNNNNNNNNNNKKQKNKKKKTTQNDRIPNEIPTHPQQKSFPINKQTKK
jgi:hypothetical protein